MQAGRAPAGQWPFVSVVILNYNGRQYLEDCLSSVERVDYPHERLETILVDNASSDGSVDLVAERFPRVRLIRNQDNLGFAGGNNAALRGTEGDYIALLNNDTKVEADWLKELVLAAEADQSIGACTSKIVFLRDRVTLEIESGVLCPADLSGSPDAHQLGVTVTPVEVAGLPAGKGFHFGAGFCGENHTPEGAFRWMSGLGRMAVEVPEGAEALTVRLRLGLGMPDGLPPVPVKVRVGGHEVASFPVSRDSSGQPYDIVIPRSGLAGACRVIQNAGSLLLRDGSGKDRGDCSADGVVRHEEDQGQYDSAQEVFSFCGASALLRRRMLDDVGLLDESFFVYYEDTDLAWRARLRGWKIVYVPTSLVRHVHCGTSGEWSPFFIFHVERNRLSMLLKNAPLGLAGACSARYLWDTLGLWRQSFESGLRRDRAGARSASGQALMRTRVLAAVAWRLPRLLWKRAAIRRGRRLDDAEIVRWMVEP